MGLWQLETLYAHHHLWAILLVGGSTVGEWDSQLREVVVEGRIQEDVRHGEFWEWNQRKKKRHRAE